MHKDSSTTLIFQKSVKRLLIPFLLFLLLGLLIDGWIQYTKSSDFNALSFMRKEIGTFSTLLILWPTGPSWFLLSLFVARISFNVLYKKIHPLIITIVFACFANIIYIMNSHGWEISIFIPGHHAHLDFPTFYMGNMCHGLSVYSLGYYLKEKQFGRTIFAAALALFILKYIISIGIDFRANEPSGDYFMLSVLSGMSGCIVFNNIFKRIGNIRIPIVTYIGSNSMVYYLVHAPIIYVTTSLFWEPFAKEELWYRFLVLSVIVTIFLAIAEYIFRIKKLRFIIGG